MSLPDTRTMLHLRLTLSCTAWAAVGYIAIALLLDGPAGFGDEFPSLPIVTIAVGLLVSLVVGTWQWRFYGTGRVRIRRTVLIDAPVAEVLARAAEAATALGASVRGSTRRRAPSTCGCHRPRHRWAGGPVSRPSPRGRAAGSP